MFSLFNLLFFCNFHIFSPFNLGFYHLCHIFSQLNLPFFHIFHIISQFNLLLFHDFHIISQFPSVFSKSFQYSTWNSVEATMDDEHGDSGVGVAGAGCCCCCYSGVNVYGCCCCYEGVGGGCCCCSGVNVYGCCCCSGFCHLIGSIYSGVISCTRSTRFCQSKMPLQACDWLCNYHGYSVIMTMA